MASTNRWAIRDVAKASYYDVATGAMKAYLQNLKTSGIENAAETVYARGGSGAPRLVGFSSMRDATISLEDAVFTNQMLALMTGNDIATQSAEVYVREELVVASDAVTLTNTPADAGALEGIFAFENDGTNGTEQDYAAVPATPVSGEYTVASKVVTFFTGDFADGAKVIVYYKADTDATAQTITVSTDSFGGTYRLVLDCIVRDVYTHIDYAAQIEIPRVKIEDNWSITMAAEGDPSTFTIPMMALKPSNSTTLYTMKIYDEGELA